MIVDFVCVLIETAEGIYLVVSTVRDRGIDQASRSLAKGPSDFRAVTIHTESSLDWRVWHEEGIV